MTSKTTQRVGFLVEHEVMGPYMQAKAIAADAFVDKRCNPVLSGVSSRRGTSNLLKNNPELRSSQENAQFRA